MGAGSEGMAMERSGQIQDLLAVEATDLGDGLKWRSNGGVWERKRHRSSPSPGREAPSKLIGVQGWMRCGVGAGL